MLASGTQQQSRSQGHPLYPRSYIHPIPLPTGYFDTQTTVRSLPHMKITELGHCGLRKLGKTLSIIITHTRPELRLDMKPGWISSLFFHQFLHYSNSFRPIYTFITLYPPSGIRHGGWEHRGQRENPGNKKINGCKMYVGTE